MKARQAGIRALLLAVLAVVGWSGSAHAGWMWDTNADRIDDRIASVESGGLAAAHVGGLLSGRLRFAVLNGGASGTRARSGVTFYRREARSADGLEVRRRKAILVE